MSKIEIGLKEKIHFIGIGGIGMSGLAQVMSTMGFKVQGSDLVSSKNVERCKKIGIQVFKTHSRKNIKDSTIIVKSSAVRNNNPEIRAAKEKKLNILKRAEMLAHVVSLKTNIVITGSHGKTTTTSLISKILSSAKLDPTIINGGVINSFNSNARLGKGEWAVLEADESDGSFLNFPVNYSVVTNLDREHLDFYKNFKNLQNSFIKFLNKTPPIGKSFICIDNSEIKKIISKINNKNFLTYGFSKKANFKILNPIYNKDFSIFDLKINVPGSKSKNIKKIKLNLIGKHNILNSVGAIALCLHIGIRINVIKRSLKKFTGIQRRLTKIFTIKGREFFDDYAHHPTEISSVLDGVKEVYKKKEIVCIFQPHRISRVKNLKFEFSRSFKKADTVILCPIYKASENIKLGFAYEKFAKLIIKNSNVSLIKIENEDSLKKLIKQTGYGEKIYIGMGAGSISNWMRNL